MDYRQQVVGENLPGHHRFYSVDLEDVDFTDLKKVSIITIVFKEQDPVIVLPEGWRMDR